MLEEKKRIRQAQWPFCPLKSKGVIDTVKQKKLMHLL